MTFKWLTAIVSSFVFVFILAQMPRTANAFECPKHIAAAQAEIENAFEGMMGMAGMDPGDMGALKALIDDAKVILADAIRNHENPRGEFDHARAIAQAKSAFAYAEQADIYHFKLMM